VVLEDNLARQSRDHYQNNS